MGKLRIKASGVLESLIAAVIISVCLSIAALTLSNLHNKPGSPNVIKAQLLAFEMEFAIRNKINVPERADEQDFVVSIEEVEMDHGLKHIKLIFSTMTGMPIYSHQFVY
jgi:hypothetical protein